MLWLAQQLRPYGVRPKTLWIGGEAAKGYSEEDFTEVFRRYVPRAALRAWIEEARETQWPTCPEAEPPPGSALSGGEVIGKDGG